MQAENQCWNKVSGEFVEGSYLRWPFIVPDKGASCIHGHSQSDFASWHINPVNRPVDSCAIRLCCSIALGSTPIGGWVCRRILDVREPAVPLQHDTLFAFWWSRKGAVHQT